MENLTAIRDQWIGKINTAETLKALEAVRVSAMGKQGEISLLMKSLGQMAPEERKEKGARLNQLRVEITQALERRQETLEQQDLEQRLAREKVDVTLSVDPLVGQGIHPLSQALFEAIEIFKDMGFLVAEGPDIETDFYNFNALNIPEEHPARQEQDTFYLPASKKGETMVLRTHTSPVQIRTMLKKKPPVRIIAPGRVFRSDYDQTHTPTFHQIEGLYIDKEINMGHLRGCLLEFVRRFFDVPDLVMRIRPSYFPFTEPSAEVDIACSHEDGRLKIGGEGEWLEILGSGMVHENVLRACEVDPEKYQGFAFGMGIERIAMLKYGIPDLRSFYETDIRWMRHYGFSPFSGLMGGAAK